MDPGKFATIALGVLAVLGYLRIAPNGPQVVRRIKARIETPRKQREAQQEAIAQLHTALADVQTRFAGLLTILDKDSEAQETRFQGLERQVQVVASAVAELGTLVEGILKSPSSTYPRAEPNAQDVAKVSAYPLGDPRNADAAFQATLDRLSHPF